MCDWGGGPNQAYNYVDDGPRASREPRAVYCQSLVTDERGGLHGCKTLLQGFTHSSVYSFYSDPVVHQHFREVEHYRPLEEHVGYRLCSSDWCGHSA